MRQVLGQVRRAPFTVVVVALLIAAAIASRPAQPASTPLLRSMSIDADVVSGHEWWTFVTADFFVDNLGQLIVVLCAAVIALGTAERLMGSARSAAAFVLTGLLGSGIGFAIQSLGIVSGEFWVQAVRSQLTVDPLTPIFGTLAVASAFAPVLWRRRIRTVVVAISVVFVLYSGLPSDFYRLIATLAGLLIGSIAVGRGSRTRTRSSSHHETRVLLAAVATVVAVGPAIAVFSKSRFGLLSPLGVFVSAGSVRFRGPGPHCDPTISHACVALVAGPGIHGAAALALALIPLTLVLIGARGLVVGHRAAVYLVAAVAVAEGLLAGFYFGFLPAIGHARPVPALAPDSTEFTVWLVANVALPICFGLVLVSQRRHFPVSAGRAARRRFITIVGSAAIAACALYLSVGSMLASQFRPAISFSDLLADLPERFIPLSYLVAERREFVPGSLPTALLYHGIGPAFWLVVLGASVAYLRREGVRGGPVSESGAIRNLLRVSGGSMSYPVAWAGNHYWFDPTHRVAIGYRVANGCAITTGGPVGDPALYAAALHGFVTFCDEHAWTPAFYGVHDQTAAPLVQAGWSSISIAEETLIDPGAWDTTGKKWQDIRSSINRAARDGVVSTWGSLGSFSAMIVSQIAEISELWVVEKGLPELEFTIGGLDQLHDPDVLMGIAVDTHGTVHAVTSWLPCWRDGVLVGYTLDFMRRRAEGMSGVMEFLIAEAAARAKAEGLAFLSLSGAPLATGQDESNSDVLRGVLDLVGRSLEPVYGFRSLLAFKTKFQPRLVPLRLVFPDAMALPAIGVAVAQCYLPNLSLVGTARLMGRIRRQRTRVLTRPITV